MTATELAERKAGLIDALVEDEHLGHAQAVLIFDADHWHVLTVEGLTPAQMSDRLAEIAFELVGGPVHRATVEV